MKRYIKSAYQCYYYETIPAEDSTGRTRKYYGKKVYTERFDTEEEADEYCRRNVGVQKFGDDYIENEMHYEQV